MGQKHADSGRTEADKIEIERRIEIYSQQVDAIEKGMNDTIVDDASLEGIGIFYEPWKQAPKRDALDELRDNALERYVQRYPNSGVESLGADWYKGLRKEFIKDAKKGLYAETEESAKRIKEYFKKKTK